MKNLETERLILRKIVKEDTEDIFNNWAKDPEVVRYLTWTNHKTVEDTKLIVDKWLEDYQSKDTYRWIVILKAYDIAIGMIDVVAFNKKDKRAEIGYCYGKKYWGNGYATEALREVINYLKNTDIELITANHSIYNPQSGKVMEKAGMKYIGTFEKWVKGNDNERHDVKFYSYYCE